MSLDYFGSVVPSKVSSVKEGIYTATFVVVINPQTFEMVRYFITNDAMPSMIGDGNYIIVEKASGDTNSDAIQKLLRKLDGNPMPQGTILYPDKMVALPSKRPIRK